MKEPREFMEGRPAAAFFSFRANVIYSAVREKSLAAQQTANRRGAQREETIARQEKRAFRWREV